MRTLDSWCKRFTPSFSITLPTKKYPSSACTTAYRFWSIEIRSLTGWRTLLTVHAAHENYLIYVYLKQNAISKCLQRIQTTRQKRGFWQNSEITPNLNSRNANDHRKTGLSTTLSWLCFSKLHQQCQIQSHICIIRCQIPSRTCLICHQSQH